MSKKTVAAIIERKNHYLIKVKKNQPRLYEAILKQVQSQEAIKKYKNLEKTRNRQTIRQVQVFSVPLNLEPLWKNAGSVITVERSGSRGEEWGESISYYLCSLPPLSRHLAEGIRGHWLIENQLHWVKDVILEEDISPQKTGFAPVNLSLLKTWVLTLLRIHGYSSISEAIQLLNNNLKYLLTFC